MEDKQRNNNTVPLEEDDDSDDDMNPTSSPSPSPSPSAFPASAALTSNAESDLTPPAFDEVPRIEQYIISRFPLHSSRLDSLDSWISYWHLRKKVGWKIWVTGLFCQPIQAIEEYFGQEVAFHYSFMNFYTRSLVIPSLVGLLLFLTQLSVRSIDTPMVPFFSLFFAIWSSILLEVWRRREISYSWRWGTYEYEAMEEEPRPQFEGENLYNEEMKQMEKIYPKWKRGVKVTMAVVIWLSFLGAFAYFMLHVFSNWDEYIKKAQAVDTGTGYFSLDQLFVPCLWGLLIPSLDYLCHLFAQWMTSWENWKYESTYRAVLILKVFSFRFINAFLAVYYYMLSSDVVTGASDQSNMSRVTTSVASFMLAGQLMRFCWSVGEPYMTRKWNGWRAKAKAEKRRKEKGRTGQHEEEEEETVELSQAWLESTYPEYDHFDDYANIAIQFGYVCFFSVAFPFAPLCALINNLLLVRVGAYKLCRLTRRPLCRPSSGIGIWMRVLQVMSVIAVITNCTIIALTSLQLDSWFPQIARATKILFIFAFEHAILVLKIAIAWAIPKETEEIHRQRKKEKLSLHQANAEWLELHRKRILQQIHAAGDSATDSLYAIKLYQEKV